MIDRQSKKESVADAAKNPKKKLEKFSDQTGKLVNTEDHIYAVLISCIEIYINYIYDIFDDFNQSLVRLFSFYTLHIKIRVKHRKYFEITVLMHVLGLN